MGSETSDLHFEDFRPGDRLSYEPRPVSRAEIVAFAREFDPQGFHLDEEAGRASMAGGLIASGWHTCALLMRMLSDGFILRAASMGSPGIEEVRWRAPLRPGAILSGGHEVLETRASRSRPDRGLVRFRFHLDDDAGTHILEQTNWILFARRGAEPPAPSVPHAPADHAPAPSPAAPLLPFEALVPGERVVLGARRFEAEEIVAYARQFDPQPFHVDADAAAASHFGKLCASGWHTGAGWMRAMVDHRTRAADAAREAGLPVPALGPSPGFRNLAWTRPVYAGDVITYASTITQTRPSGSRPGWGLVFQRNEGVNQHGETVFAFDGVVLWEGASAG